MKNFLIAATALSGLLATSGSALAADLAVPVDPVYDWSGPYIGIQGGYAWGDSTSKAFGNLGPGTVTTADLDPDGWFGGLHAGYNFQTNGNIVWGLEGDINLADIDSGNVTTLPGEFHSGQMDWNGSARVRLGFAFDRLLPYLTGGLAFGGYEVDFNHTGDSGSLDDTMVGWTVGGGFEYAFTDSLTTRVEYRYTDYGDMDGSVFPLFPLESQSADLKTQDVRVGITFNF